jgi:hypothetical protein
MVDKEWEKFLKQHTDLEMLPSGKCRCKLTGHEMVAVVSVAEVKPGLSFQRK